MSLFFVVAGVATVADVVASLLALLLPLALLSSALLSSALLSSPLLLLL